MRQPLLQEKALKKLKIQLTSQPRSQTPQWNNARVYAHTPLYPKHKHLHLFVYI